VSASPIIVLNETGKMIMNDEKVRIQKYAAAVDILRVLYQHSPG
jgi:hypothetical protein